MSMCIYIYIYIERESEREEEREVRGIGSSILISGLEQYRVECSGPQAVCR